MTLSHYQEEANAQMLYLENDWTIFHPSIKKNPLSQYLTIQAFPLPGTPYLQFNQLIRFGNTPNTIKQSNCGIQAGEDIGQTPLPIGELMDYQALYDYTIGMGYQPGLTLLPIPYDWRRMAGNNEVLTKFQRSIEYAYQITGKKVVITAHSFGCLNFLALMNSLPQSFKDQYIDSFLGLACAWTGASYVVDLTTSGLNLGWWDFGYPFSDLRNLIIGLTSLYDLLPKDIFNSTTEWGQEISQRAEQEANWNSSNPPQNIAFSWFPSPMSECYQDRKDDKQCGLHLYNFFENPLAYAENNKYMLNSTSIGELLEQYMVRTQEEIDFEKLVNEGKVSPQEQEETWGTKKLIPKERISLMMDMVKRNKVQDLINPGVQIHHIYGGHYQTDTWYNISENPRRYTDSGKTAEDAMKIETHWGDDVVNIDNAITPSLKWAWEFDNNVENAKPVHMIDYCSNYSQLMYKDSTGKYTTTYKNITQNTYNGIMCTNKQHAEFPDDEFIDKYAAALLQSGTPGRPEINLNEEDVNIMIQTCPHIMAPWQLQSAGELYEYGINKQNLEEQNIQYDFPFSQPSQEFTQFLENFYSTLPNQSRKNSKVSNNLIKEKLKK